jgi:hypothetical protein
VQHHPCFPLDAVLEDEGSVALTHVLTPDKEISAATIATSSFWRRGQSCNPFDENW